MASIMDGILNAEFSRRDFLKGTVAATAAVAGIGLLPRESALAESTAPVEHAPIVDPEEGGKWVAAACWQADFFQCCRTGNSVRCKTIASLECLYSVGSFLTIYAARSAIP